jgi:hypothetical protein
MTSPTAIKRTDSADVSPDDGRAGVGAGGLVVGEGAAVVGDAGVGLMLAADRLAVRAAVGVGVTIDAAIGDAAG